MATTYVAIPVHIVCYGKDWSSGLDFDCIDDREEWHVLAQCNGELNAESNGGTALFTPACPYRRHCGSTWSSWRGVAV